MKVLILGGAGQVGSELETLISLVARRSGIPHEVISLGRNELDVTSLSSIPEVLRGISPNYIVNASAYTAVDKAESESSLAFAVNHLAVEELAKYCRYAGCRLIHISTDYVFAGHGKSPYLETDQVNPVGTYGRSKLAGENSIREILPEHVILRTSWVFGKHGKNFVKTMLSLSSRLSEIGVVADQYGAPTSAESIASSIADIISQLENSDCAKSRWGTYHFSGFPFVSWADFAEEIFDQANRRGLISTVPAVSRLSTQEYPTPAARPANSRLDSTKIKAMFGIDADDWKASLGIVLDHLKEGLSR